MLIMMAHFHNGTRKSITTIELARKFEKKIIVTFFNDQWPHSFAFAEWANRREVDESISNLKNKNVYLIMKYIRIFCAYVADCVYIILCICIYMHIYVQTSIKTNEITEKTQLNLTQPSKICIYH